MSQASQLRAMHDYFQSLLNENPEAETASQPLPVMVEEADQSLRVQQLDQLLSQVDTAEEKLVITTPVTETQIEVVEEPQVLAPVTTWKNIEPGNEFPALFFNICGVTFAVPLTDLGGIHKLEKVTPLFGKPDWFSGVMSQRDGQINVIDSAKWFLPEQENNEEYTYIIMLGESRWGIQCHQLLGTETLYSGQIKWRDSPGRRRWLAGMVKDKMCALLHVQELLTLLQSGANIDGQ